MHVRAAAPGDATAVLDVWAAARSDHAFTDDTAEAVARLLRDAPGALLVAECEGAVVGAVIAGWDGWRGYVSRLAVLESHRRRGVASALVTAAETRLRSLGAPHVSALVGRGDTDAEAVWAAAGYRRDDTIARWVHRF